MDVFLLELLRDLKKYICLELGSMLGIYFVCDYKELVKHTRHESKL